MQENQAIWKLCNPCELIKKCYSAEEASQAAEEDEFHKAGFWGDEQRDHRWRLAGTQWSSFWPCWWSLLIISDHFWSLLITSDHFGSHLITSGHFWSFLTNSDHFGSLLIASANHLIKPHLHNTKETTHTVIQTFTEHSPSLKECKEWNHVETETTLRLMLWRNRPDFILLWLL